MTDTTVTQAAPVPTPTPIVQPAPIVGGQVVDVSKERAAQDQPFGFGAKPAGAPADQTASARMRAFEDAHFGKDAVRINGLIERGHGSAFTALDPAAKNQYAAIERFRDAEIALGVAEGDLSIAQAAHATATAAVENAARATDGIKPGPVGPLASADGNWTGPTVKEFVAAGYSARNYPPQGYASRSTPDEVAAAVAEEQKSADAAKAKADAKAKSDADAAAKDAAKPAPVLTPAGA